MSSTTAAWLSRRDRERVDAADADAGDLDVLALDDERRRCRRSRAPGSRSRPPAPDGDERPDEHAGDGDGDEDAPHGPAGSSPGLHPPGGSRASVLALELSAVICVAAPGQRSLLPWSRASSRWPAGIAVSSPPPGVSLKEKALAHRRDARVVAVGVVVGGALAEVAQPADEVRRVGPVEGDDLAAVGQRLGRRAAATAPATWLEPAGTSASRRRGRCWARARLTSRRRSAIVGRASATSGRSRRRNGARSRGRRLGRVDQPGQVAQRSRAG